MNGGIKITGQIPFKMCFMKSVNLVQQVRILTEHVTTTLVLQKLMFKRELQSQCHPIPFSFSVVITGSDPPPVGCLRETTGSLKLSQGL